MRGEQLFHFAGRPAGPAPDWNDTVSSPAASCASTLKASRDTAMAADANVKR
jgi:hypothetical protein